MNNEINLFGWMEFSAIGMIASCILCIIVAKFINQFSNVENPIRQQEATNYVPTACNYAVCEFLEARDLCIVQCLSKEWRSCASFRIRFLLENKYRQSINHLMSLSLTQQLYRLETEELIPLWADKKTEFESVFGIPCPRLGKLVMQMIRHSQCSQWNAFHSGSIKGFEIRPREGRSTHPFGDLSVMQFPEQNSVILYFVRDFVTTVMWDFKIVDRTWYLTSQDSNMKSGYMICPSWLPSKPMEEEAFKPEFRERNRRGIGIIEETCMFWQEIQDHFLEPPFQLQHKPFCSLPSCSVQHAKKRCSQCKISYYCSKEHQVMHWKEHKSFCRRFPSLDNLVAAYEILEDTNTQKLSIFDMMRRKAHDCVSGREWYVD